MTQSERNTALVQGLQALVAVKLHEDAKVELAKAGKILPQTLVAAKSIELANNSLRYVCDQRAITEVEVVLMLIKDFATAGDDTERSPIKERFRAGLVDLIECHLAVMQADQELLVRNTLIPSK